MESYAFARVIAPAFRAEEGALDAMVGMFRRAMRGAPRSVASAAVFGSVARREETDGSDVDLLIVSSAPRAALEFIARPRMEAEAKFGVFVSPLAMTKGRFRSPLNKNLARSIVRDHILVHGERLDAILGRPAGRASAPRSEAAGPAAPVRGASGTVRDVPRAAWRPYLARADELLAAADIAFEAKSYNAAAHSSMHAAISALDSLTAGTAGFRSAGDHAGALRLAGRFLGRRDYASLGRHIGRLLALGRLEREPDMVTRRQASDAIRSVRRVLAVVRPAPPRRRPLPAERRAPWPPAGAGDAARRGRPATSR